MIKSQGAPLLKIRRLNKGLYLFHSPLLEISLLISSPPLNNMLKFSGYPYNSNVRLIKMNQVSYLGFGLDTQSRLK